jgi:hypothetical protein
LLLFPLFGFYFRYIVANGRNDDFCMSPRSDESDDCDLLKEEPNSKSSANSHGKNGSKTTVNKDDKSGSNGKYLSVREQIRREKNRAAVKKCRKRKNERLKELESLTMKVRKAYKP